MPSIAASVAFALLLTFLPVLPAPADGPGEAAVPGSPGGREMSAEMAGREVAPHPAAIPAASGNPAVNPSAAQASGNPAPLPDARRLSSLGLRPDDPSRAAENFAILQEALAEGDSFIVDGRYHLAGESVPLRGGLSLVADPARPPGDGIVVASRGLFHPVSRSGTARILLRGIGITGTGAGAVLFLGFGPEAGGARLASLVVSDCRVHGAVSLFRHSFDGDADPSRSRNGIDRIEILRNRFENLPYSCISVENGAVDSVAIADNVVRNFRYVLLGFHVRNESRYSHAVRLSRKRLTGR